MNESYVDPTRKYPIDPMWEVTSKYYIDRMWEEYHKVKNDLAAVRIEASSAWQEYRKMKEELADTKSKLGQMDDYLNETLKPQLVDAKKSAQIAWDELDIFRITNAKLHDELMIAEGQRDQARAECDNWEKKYDVAQTSEPHMSEPAAWVEVLESGGKRIPLYTHPAPEDYDTLRAERDALLKVYEAAEDFIGAQGTAYENDQYLMLCGVLGAYNQQRGTHESQ